MTIKQEQDNEELFYLEHFLKRMMIETECIKRGEDPPDFYVQHGSDRMAVEMTEYHSARKGSGGHTWREVEEAWKAIQNLITKERVRYPTLEDVWGILFFRSLKMPQAGKHGKFVTELLEFAISKHSTLTKIGSVFDSFPSRFPLLKKYLEKLQLKKLNCYIAWKRASAPSAACVGINENALEKCVSKKLKTSRPQRITENWLLIVSGTNMSQQIGPIPCGIFNRFAQLNSRLETSPFDRVFFYQYMFSRVLRWSRNKKWEEVKPAITCRGEVTGLQ